MTTKQIEVFLRLANTLSFARTAEELFTTQPCVSRIIQSLENEIHVKLFLRDKHHVELTPAGQALQKELTQINRDISDAVNRAQARAARFESQLTVGFCHEASVSNLWQAMRSFSVRYPTVYVRPKSTSLRKLQSGFERGSLDLVFGMKSELCPGPEDILQRLYRGYWVAVMGDNYPLSGCNTLRLSDLNGHTLLRWEDPDHPLQVLELCKRLRTDCPDSKYTYFSDMQELRMATRAGYGVTIIPQYSIPAAPGQRMIPLIHEGQTGDIDYMVMRHRRDTGNHAREFVEIMRGYYPDETLIV